MIQNKWMNHSTSVYHIFIDRFAGFIENCEDDKPVFCFGNLKGITEKISYIKSMGFDTVWISPFFETSAYHGYHITDFDAVDKRFGTIDDLKMLIRICHASAMKIIADIVPNHCSAEHKWFKEAHKNPKSKYRQWFYFNPSSNDYLKFLGFSILPKLNLENPEVSEYMINSLSKWAELGFDGFRIDHVVGLPDRFLENLRYKLGKINDNFILIGEAWSEGMKYKHLKTLRLSGKHKLWQNGFKQVDLQNHYEGLIDGVLDFGWRDMLLSSMKLIQNKEFKKLQIRFDEYNKQCSQSLILPKFLDNHDTNRIMYMCNNNETLFKEYLKILFRQPSPVVLFYGTEYGISQDKGISPDINYSDLYARSIIPWHTNPKYKDFIVSTNEYRKKPSVS